MALIVLTVQMNLSNFYVYASYVENILMERFSLEK